MNDFSIQNSINDIHSDKTREYFREVANSYYNGNYRASVVTLYSVVICDIIAKLETLEEIYSDSNAKSILSETKQFQEDHPTNPDWEKEIIDKIKTRTSIIDNTDYTLIKSLQNLRHLCAHPVINKENKLYTPNKETVASHIRNMMELLFLKPPLLSKKILATILTDIADKKEILIDEESLEKYVVSKYLNNLSSTVEVNLFREIWKFVLKLDNPDAEENRLINYRVIYLLYKRNTEACIEKIKAEQTYFSNIHNEPAQINFFIRFIAESHFLYKEFREDIHLLVNKHVETDNSAKLVAWFLSDSFLDHLDVAKSIIKKYYDNLGFKRPSAAASTRLISIGLAKGYIKEVCDYLVWRYSSAKNYHDADLVFSYEIEPNLNHFTEEQLIKLLSDSNQNSQTYDRKQASEDHLILKALCENRITNFTMSDYPNTFKNVPNSK